MANYAGLELHEACASGDTDAVEECIKSGIDVNIKDTDWNDRTPLHWAAMKGHGDIVQLLLRNRADPNLLMDNGWSPLHSAAETGRQTILVSLVQYGGDVFKQDRYGDTPRAIAQIHGNIDCVKYLHGLERQICEDVARKAEEERLASEAAAMAAAAKAAAALVKCSSRGRIATRDETTRNTAPSSDNPKTVTLVEGPSSSRSGPTGPILRRTNTSSKQTTGLSQLKNTSKKSNKK